LKCVTMAALSTPGTFYHLKIIGRARITDPREW
jgi:hypothetical protein